MRKSGYFSNNNNNHRNDNDKNSMPQHGSGSGSGGGRIGGGHKDKPNHPNCCSCGLINAAVSCPSFNNKSNNKSNKRKINHTLWILVTFCCLAFLQIVTTCFYAYRFGDVSHAFASTTPGNPELSLINVNAKVRAMQTNMESLIHRLEYLEQHAATKLPDSVQPPPPQSTDSLHASSSSRDQKMDHYNSVVAGKSSSSFNRTLAFLHIGKTGGSSFDIAAKRFCLVAGYNYKGNQHFDWSYIEQRFGVVGKDVHVVTLLREPVSRAISHFYFTQRQKWVKNTYFVHMSLSDFLHDRHALLDFRDIWQDGQAGVSWLTGTHIASWASVPKEEIPERERRASNTTAMMLLAADRLDSTLWFGILEDMDRSMELLQFELGLPTRLQLTHANKAKVSSLAKGHALETTTEQEKRELASLMPQDLWLYEYAKRLFEARWTKHTTGIYTPPIRPPLPTTLHCTSTRFELSCTSGPLAGIVDHDKSQQQTLGSWLSNKLLK